MPDIIDEFVVKLSLDPRQYQKQTEQFRADLKKTQDQADRQAKDISRSGKQAQESFSGLTREVVSLGAAFLGLRGVKEFITDTTRTNTQLANLAPNLRTNVRELGTWAAALERFGGKADDAASSFASLSQQFTNMQFGQFDQNFIAAMNKLGLTFADLQNPAGFLQKAGQSLGGMEPAQRQMFGGMLGLTPDMINFVSRNQSQIAKDLLAAEEAGRAREADARTAKERTDAFAKVQQDAEALFTQALTAATPSMVSFATGLDSFLKWLDSHDVGKSFGQGVDNALTIHTPWGSAGDMLQHFFGAPTAHPGDGHSAAVDLSAGTPDQGASDLPPEARAILDAISGPESAGNYDVRFGGAGGPKRFDTSGGHPRALETIPAGMPYAGSKSDAAGAFQMISSTWDYARSLANLPDIMTPENQRKAAWALITSTLGGAGNAISEIRDPSKWGDLQARLAPIWGSFNPDRLRAAGGGAPAVNSRTSNSSTSINGPITINTQADDAQGIARDLHTSIRSYNFSSGVNAGLTP